MNSANNENGAGGPGPEEEPAVGDSEPGGAGEPGDISAEAAAGPERSAGRGEASAEAAEFLGIELDENFVRGASVIEPSAKERERTAERERRVIQLKRRRRRLRRAVTLHGWRTRRSQRKAGSAPMTSDSGHPRLPALRVAIFFVLVVALIGVAIYLPGRSSNTGTAPPVNWNNVTLPPSASASAGGNPDAQVSCNAGDPGCGSMDQPFAQSPAAGYKVGADGIVLPPAAATADFSASEVAQDLQLAKQFLIAQNLNPEVLFHAAYPTDMAAMMDPRDAAQMHSYFENPTVEKNPSTWATRFDPATTALIGSEIRVNGVMTFSESKNGMLDVQANYLFVYPVHRPNTTVWTRVDDRKVETISFNPGEKAIQVWWEGGPGTGPSGASCAFHNGLLEPVYPDSQDDGPQPSGPAIDPFAPPTLGGTPGPSAQPVPTTGSGSSVVGWVEAAPTPTPTGVKCGVATRT